MDSGSKRKKEGESFVSGRAERGAYRNAGWPPYDHTDEPFAGIETMEDAEEAATLLKKKGALMKAGWVALVMLAFEAGVALLLFSIESAWAGAPDWLGLNVGPLALLAFALLQVVGAWRLYGCPGRASPEDMEWHYAVGMVPSENISREESLRIVEEVEQMSQ